MTTERRSHRRSVRLAATAAATAAALALLAACGGSSGDSAGTSSDAGAKPAASGGSSTAIPTQDVVSAVTADPKLTAELPAKVRASGTLTLGTTLQPGVQGLPHAGQDNGKDVGLDVDLRNAVAKVLGVTWKVQNGTFPTIIPGVQNGRYDVGQDNFGATKEREKVVDFATYLNDGQAFLGSRTVSLTSVKKLTDLCGLTVATSPGSTFQQILTDGAGDCAKAGKKPYKVQYFADSAPIFLGLANGKVDVMFGPTLGLKYDATRIAGTRFLGQISTTAVGFVTARNSPIAPALRDAVNKLIADGTYAKIFAKWGVPGTGITKSELNPATTF